MKAVILGGLGIASVKKLQLNQSHGRDWWSSHSLAHHEGLLCMGLMTLSFAVVT